jgi:hypothetical protein
MLMEPLILRLLVKTPDLKIQTDNKVSLTTFHCFLSAGAK